MSIFDNLPSNASNTQANALNRALEQIKRNPAETLKQRGFNIPAGMNNPQQIVQHLLQSGQIGNGKLQAAMQMIGRR